MTDNNDEIFAHCKEMMHGFLEVKGLPANENLMHGSLIVVMAEFLNKMKSSMNLLLRHSPEKRVRLLPEQFMDLMIAGLQDCISDLEKKKLFAGLQEGTFQ